MTPAGQKVKGKNQKDSAIDSYDQMMLMRERGSFTELADDECCNCDGHTGDNLHRSRCVGCNKHPLDDAIY